MVWESSRPPLAVTLSRGHSPQPRELSRDFRTPDETDTCHFNRAGALDLVQLEVAEIRPESLWWIKVLAAR